MAELSTGTSVVAEAPPSSWPSHAAPAAEVGGETAPALDAIGEYARQDIRIAAVLNGGVSLAVWMSGVVLEFHHLALSSKNLGSWQTYRGVLGLLAANARVDVISGTSAGGLNGAFLALGLARERDLAHLRNLWRDSGALGDLLRPALDKDPPSVLAGDGYFLTKVRDALKETVTGSDNVPDRASGGPVDCPVELILTGTLWNGRESTFTDDMGVGITERDYDATFRFVNGDESDGVQNLSGDLSKDDVLDRLAEAARCSSSFPGAFEPHKVTISADFGKAGERRWGSSAGQANFDNAQYVLDGGVLLNKPIRPALEAIYKQPGAQQIRRVLVYINPDPGEPPPPARMDPKQPLPASSDDIGPAPLAVDVLLNIMTRLKSTDSVSQQLQEIRDRNAAVRGRRRARARLSAAMTRAPELPDVMWPGYQGERNLSAAALISRLLASGQPTTGQYWSERELSDVLINYSREHGFTFVPHDNELSDALNRQPADWPWGQSTVLRLADMTTDLLKRAVWHAQWNSPLQEKVYNLRTTCAGIIDSIKADRAALNNYWIAAPSGDKGERFGAVPTRKGGSNQPATNLAELRQWISNLVPLWDTVPTASGVLRAELMHGQAMQLASVLYDHKAEIKAVIENPNTAIDPSGTSLEQLAALYNWLFAATGSNAAAQETVESEGSVTAGQGENDVANAEEVLRRMLRLDVVQLAASGALEQVEQEVELVQVSCSNRAVVTGMQMHHFGAFYRAPWRVNDWIEGRLNGASQLMRLLLSPDRLRQCRNRYTIDEWLGHLKDIAVADNEYRAYLDRQWNLNEAAYRSDLEAVFEIDSDTATLNRIANALSLPLRLQILAEDLPALASAITAEARLNDAPVGSVQWLAKYQTMETNGNRQLSAENLLELHTAMQELVGKQTIANDIGSDTFARTMSHAATVTASTFNSPPKVSGIKAIRFVLSATRGYTAMVWAMVHYMTMGSSFGKRAVDLAVGAGAALLAVTILVPGVPLGVTLIGVLLVLSGVTAASLLVPGAGGWFAGRLAVVGLIIAAALGVLIWRDIHEHGLLSSAAISTLIKVGVGLLIVLLGSFVSRAKPSTAEIAWVLIGLVSVAAIAGMTTFAVHLWRNPPRAGGGGFYVLLVVATVAALAVGVFAGITTGSSRARAAAKAPTSSNGTLASTADGAAAEGNRDIRSAG
jgi:patatin-related protein